MRRPFSLIKIPDVSIETVQCLRALLAEAEAGTVLGVAYCAMHKQRHYTIHTCGEAFKNPTFSLGMVQVLSDDLAERVRAGK